MTFDEMMYYIGFVPVIGDVTDIYFLIKYAYEGDWENFVITAVGAAIPFVGGSYLRAAREGGEALYDILRRVDDVPTTPVKNADDIVTVRHYTDATTARKIEASGYLRQHSWVGPSAQIKAGMKQSDIADLLALPAPSRAECYIDVQVHLSDIYIDPAQGIKAQPLFGWGGGGFQYRLANDIPIDNARFLPTFW